MPDDRDRSAPALVGDLVNNVTELVRKELQLLRAELNEKSTQAVTAVGSIVAAVVMALVALNVLAAALVSALTKAGIPAVWSAVIVGVVLAIIAGVVGSKGMSSLKASSLTPERTAQSTRRDAGMIKEKL